MKNLKILNCRNDFFTLLGVDHNQLDLNSDVSISVSHQDQTSNYYEISYYIVECSSKLKESRSNDNIEQFSTSVSKDILDSNIDYFANPSLDL